MKDSKGRTHGRHVRNTEADRGSILPANVHSCPAVHDKSQTMTRALGHACRYGGPEQVRVLLNAGAKFEYPETPESVRQNAIVEKRDPLSRAIERYLWFLDTALPFPDVGKNLLVEMDKRAARLDKVKQKRVLTTIMESEFESGFDLGKLKFLAALYGDTSVLGMAKCRDPWGSDWEFAHFMMGSTSRRNPDDIFRVAIVEAMNRSEDPDAMLQRVKEVIENTRLGVRPVDVRQAIRLGYIPELRDDLMLPLLLHTTYTSSMERNELLRWSVLHNRADVLGALVERHSVPRIWRSFADLIQFAKDNKCDEAIISMLEQALRDSGLKPPKPRKQMTASQALVNSWGYEPIGKNKALLTWFRGRTDDDENVTVPEKFAGRTVTQISENMFSATSRHATPETRAARVGVRSLTIPGTVAAIPAGFMSKHQNVRSLTLCEGVSSIGPEAFFGCTELTEVRLPSTLTQIGADAFRGCTNLKTVEGLGPDVEAAEGAFCDCPSLADEYGMIRIGGRLLGLEEDKVPDARSLET